MRKNLILQTDSYKPSHWKQSPPGTTTVYSYLESRGGRFPATLFCLLQYYLQEYLRMPITQQDIDEAKTLYDSHVGPGIFNEAGWQHILDAHEGFLPLEIRAVPEGTLVPTGNVLMTIHNTDESCPWLTNYVETLLMKVWAPITVATNSYYARQRIQASAEKTGSNPAGIDFKLHDFGYRGVSSEESAGILGAAHLLNFKGSDTMAAICLLMHHYSGYQPMTMPAFSVPASEHSTATPYGRGLGEKEYILNMLNKYSTGIVSCIGDSYDMLGMAELVSTDATIRNLILSRDGTFVLRLDSGDPQEMVQKVLDILWRNVGGTYTDKSYRLLDPHYRILQGDGIDNQAIDDILTMMENNKYASDNIIFGSGGGLLQKFDRDTQSFAIKCSYCVINEKEVNVQKDPKSGSSKKSKQGKLKLHKSGGAYMTISSATETPAMFNSYTDELRLVFRNGVLFNQETLETIRNRVKNQPC